MDFRHEWKYEINASDMIAVRQRLRAAARPDPHAVEGKYLIRSLYFDNLADKALLEKLDGVNQREKFRIRYYNGDASLIHLVESRGVEPLSENLSARLSTSVVGVLTFPQPKQLPPTGSGPR